MLPMGSVSTSTRIKYPARLPASVPRRRLSDVVKDPPELDTLKSVNNRNIRHCVQDKGLNICLHIVFELNP